MTNQPIPPPATDAAPAEAPADRRRRLARERQRRRRYRLRTGRCLIELPSDLADELGESNGEIAQTAARILRRVLFGARDKA